MAGHGWAWLGMAGHGVARHGEPFDIMAVAGSFHCTLSARSQSVLFCLQVHAGYALFEVVFWQRSAAVAAPWNEMVFLGNLITLLMASAALVSTLTLPDC